MPVIAIASAIAAIAIPTSTGACPSPVARQDYKRAARIVYSHRHIHPGARQELAKLYDCLPSPEARSWARQYLARLARQRRLRLALTGYVISGGTSAFGAGTEDGDSQTADGGDTRRPCIALRDTSTLDDWFLVTVAGHQAILLHCDSGPYVAGRSIDITGPGVTALGMNPVGYGNYYGKARRLRYNPCGTQTAC